MKNYLKMTISLCLALLMLTATLSVQAADEPFNLFGASLHTFIQRPLIGIITKVDSPKANVDMIRLWMENAGCNRIFLVNNINRDGISELLEYLQEDLPPLTWQEAKAKQDRGIAEWESDITAQQ